MSGSKFGFLAMVVWSSACAGIWAHSVAAAGAVAAFLVALAWLAEEYLGGRA